MNKLNLISAAVAIALLGCGGDDGKSGADGTNGANGSNGTNGNNGLVSLIKQSGLAVGDVHCLNSGVAINSGLDSNKNQQLDDTEVTSTEYVCTPTITKIDVDNTAVTTTTRSNWYQQSETQLALAKKAVNLQAKQGGKAKNVILFVGDGMGISTVTAARILAGQNLGKLGEEHQLSLDKLAYSGFAKTYNTNAQTPDSAGTMTALISGVKTDMGVLGINENVERGDCATATNNQLFTALELAEIAGKSTGVVSTARITHATPAAAYAKSVDRNWEDISDMKLDKYPERADCEDIASQLVNFEKNLEKSYPGIDVDGLEVAMGGGRRHFLPKDIAFNTPDAVSAVEGDRTDGQDLTAQWQAAYPQGQYVIDQASFNAINPATTTHLFGLFNESHMQYEADRHNDISGEPSLSEMTRKAIDILDNNDKGFFLTVEAGRIDHAHHAGNAYNALTDTIEFDKAVQAALDATSVEDTLIIVTADHSHVFTIAGYPKRGNPILGKVVAVGETEPSLASDEMPYTTVGYTNGNGFKDLGHETDADEGYDYDIVTGRVDLTQVDTLLPGFHQEALVPRSSETHAGEDVGVYASGPGAHLVTGTNEQSYLFHVMNYAADLINQANKVIK